MLSAVSIWAAHPEHARERLVPVCSGSPRCGKQLRLAVEASAREWVNEPSRACSAAEHDRIERLVRLHSNATIQHSSHFTIHGLFGIFARGRGNYLDYEGVKTSFIHKHAMYALECV